MRILSFDVGIKNLAYCYYDTSCQTIIDWAVVDLCDDNQVCSTAGCYKNASYTKHNVYYCNKHIKQQLSSSNTGLTLVLPTEKVSCDLIMECSIAKLRHFADLFDVKQTQTFVDEKGKTKQVKYSTDDLRMMVCEYIEENLYECVMTRSAKNVDLVEIGRNMDKYFTKLFDNENEDEKSSKFEIPDIILIENQISPIANRMKTIQGMIAQFFITRFDKKYIDIKFVSSSNKLKGFVEGKTTYDERKKKGIEVTKKLLEENSINYELWFYKFTKHTKKDDLADSYLQALWYVRNVVKQ